MLRKINSSKAGIALIATLMLASFLSAGCAESSSKHWAQLSPLIQPTPVSNRDKPSSILSEKTATSTRRVSRNGSTTGSMR